MTSLNVDMLGGNTVTRQCFRWCLHAGCVLKICFRYIPRCSLFLGAYSRLCSGAVEKPRLMRRGDGGAQSMELFLICGALGAHTTNIIVAPIGGLNHRRSTRLQ